MSTTTTNLGLIKPELTDAADITAMNPNWDKLDNHDHDGRYYKATGVERGANMVLAAPDRVNGDATFRKLVADDLPILPATKGGTGATTAAQGFQTLLTRATVNNDNIVDANTLNTSGSHMVYIENDGTYDHTAYNFPYRYGVLLVTNNGGYVSQIFLTVSAETAYFRTSYNSGVNWTEWKTIYTNKNLPTDADTVDGIHVQTTPGNAGIKPIYATTVDLTAGTSALATGTICFIYE